jgi:GNAT superfamily N-acetyltransferase
VATGRARLEAFEEDFELGNGEIYLFDAFTLPEHRGLRIQAAIFAHVRDRYLAKGFERALSLTGPENRGTIRSRERLGFRRAGGIARVKLGPWCWRFAWGGRELRA